MALHGFIRMKSASVMALGLALCSCGGSGTNSASSNATGGGSTATPAVNYNTQEYQNSSGSVAMNALAAYNAGATGSGITVGVIDTGIDTGSSEFSGRISSSSRDVVAGSARSVDDTYGHGTEVSSIIGAARNNSGIMGVAFNSTLLALRADSPGSCASSGGCTFYDTDLATGVNTAVAAGARVINISLGGNSAPGSTFVSAIANAASHGVIVVISAGNDGTANPEAFALVANNASAQNMVIIAGAMNQTNTALASFSNQAGSGAAHYLAAMGENVPVVMLNDVLGAGDGTSFAAPQIAGAAALLAQAFPNLTGAQIVNLLYSSATDAGAAGVDSVYGQGVLSLTKAFQPVGTTSLASTATTLSLTSNGSLGAPLGDAGQTTQALNGAIILDGYSRAYALNLAGTLSRTPVNQSLAAHLQGNYSAFSNGNGTVMVSVSIHREPGKSQPWVGFAQSGLSADDARVARAVAGSVVSRLGANTRIAFGYSETGVGLIDRMSGRTRPAFLIAGTPQGTPGFEHRTGDAVAVSQQLGGLTLTASLEQGQAVTWQNDGQNGYQQRHPYSIANIAAARSFGPLQISLGLGVMNERATLLGSSLAPVFGIAGAATRLADVGADLHLGDRWLLSGKMRQGWTSARTGNGLVIGANIVTRGFSADLTGENLVLTDDRFGLRLSQPLRVAGGGFHLSVPVSYDYATGAAAIQSRTMSLTPSGREIDMEASYGFAGLGGWMDLNAYYRRQPGHIASAPDDRGLALRYNTRF